MEGAQATVALYPVLEGLAVIGIGVIGYFLKRDLEQLKKNDSKINEIISDWKLMGKDVNAISETLKEVKPKLEAVSTLRRDLDTCFARYDSLKSSFESDHKRLEEHHSILNGIRERQHDMADFMTKMQLTMERHEVMKERFELKPITKKEA